MRLLPIGMVLVGALFAFELEAKAQELSETEVLDFARNVEELAAMEDVDLLDAHFDRSRFHDRIAGGIDAPAEFDEAFRSSFDASFSFGERVVLSTVRGGGTYTFLRAKKSPWRAVFRVISADGALSYHELHLDVDAGGTVKFHDAYLYTTGEVLSESLGRLYAAGVAQVNRGFFDRLQGKDVILFKHMDEIQSMSRAVESGEGNKALEIYASLPHEVQVQKTVLLARLAAAVQVDDTEYEKAMVAYQDAFPHAPELALILFDRYFLQNEFEVVLVLLGQLEFSVGGDPYIDVLRGTVHAAAGDFEQSRAALEKAIAAEPTLEAAYFSLVNTTLMFDRHALTAHTLDRITETFGYTWEIEDLPDYADFLASEEGKRWLQGSRQ